MLSLHHNQRPARLRLLCALGAVLATAACVEPSQEREPAPGPEPTQSDTGYETGDPPQRGAKPETAVVESHRWSTRLKAGDGVALVNELGELRARSSGDSGLHYAGVVQKLDGETRDPDFRTERRPEALHLRPIVPEDWYGRVDGGVRIPTGSPVSLRTVDDQIDVRLGDNDVVAESRAGRISVRTEGTIEARSDSGEMLIVLFGTRYQEGDAGRVESVSGDIELWVQPGANVTVEARAGGGVNVDAGDSGARVRQQGNEASVVVGDGRARFPVSSDQGRLTLRILPPPP